MSDTEKPVWVWLPEQVQPVRCGTFALERGLGTFHYDQEYRQRRDTLALDPFSLPFTRSARGAKETRQGGLFGVFREASPAGFGLALLEQMRGKTLDDPMLRLELSEGDSVGAVEVCDQVRSFWSPGEGPGVEPACGQPNADAVSGEHTQTRPKLRVAPRTLHK